MAPESAPHSAPARDGIFAVVTGGGTAGHVLPALAVADALVANGRAARDVHYVGCTRGIETRLLPDTPYTHTFHDVVGFQRRLSRRNVGFVPKMWRARRAAISEFRQRRPQVVVSVGGYASMPAVFAARALDIPVVVVSYDRRPGRASRLAARSAAASAVAFENSPLPRAVVTGAPVRQSILEVDRNSDRRSARARLGVPDDRFMVAVMGGSLGSGVLNAAIADYVSHHRGDVGLAVRQVAGERFVGDVHQVEPDRDGVIHQVIGYEADMAAVYTAADLLIGRGGASTVHEVAVVGIPAILIPWPGAADDHQRSNIEWLTDVGGAVMVEDARLARPSHPGHPGHPGHPDQPGVGALGGEIERLRRDGAARSALAAAAHERGDVHRSGALARLIERVALTFPAS